MKNIIIFNSINFIISLENTVFFFLPVGDLATSSSNDLKYHLRDYMSGKKRTDVKTMALIGVWA